MNLKTELSCVDIFHMTPYIVTYFWKKNKTRKRNDCWFSNIFLASIPDPMITSLVSCEEKRTLRHCFLLALRHRKATQLAETSAVFVFSPLEVLNTLNSGFCSVVTGVFFVHKQNNKGISAAVLFQIQLVSHDDSLPMHLLEVEVWRWWVLWP